MSVRTVSPGGALLRRSKVFAMPQALPGTAENNFTGQILSKSATTPYPTHISLTTPLSSLKEGDWGLKRPLPLRTTTKSSSPSVRIEAIDTIEQVTSFRSSGDHAVNLQKWQELGLPITSQASYTNFFIPTRRSVFEKDVDNIEDKEDKSGTQTKKIKWKFKGPWLAGLNNGEFSEYIKTNVVGRKKEFEEFLKAKLAISKTADAKSASIAEGIGDTAPIFEAKDITDEETSMYIKELRHDKKSLQALLRSFLDLPHTSSETLTASTETVKQLINCGDGQTKTEIVEFKLPSYSKTAPPMTHPSAGLSYNLTYAHMYNHPVYGPQKFKSPVQARVILPKYTSGMGPRKAVVGCVGFVASVPLGIDPKNVSYIKGFKMTSQFDTSRFPGLQYLQPEAKNGSKTWVHPLYAEIDSKGHLQLTWDLADAEAVAIKTDTVDELKPPIEPENSSYWKPLSISRNLAQARRPNAVQYGLNSMFDPNESSKRDNETVSELESLIADTKGMA